MEISTSSWHYRLVRLFSNMKDDVPRSLCPYLLRLAFAMFVVFVVVPLAIFGVGLVLTLTLSETYTLGTYSTWLHDVFGKEGTVSFIAGFILLAAPGLLAIIVMFCTLMSLICGIGWGLYLLYDHYMRKHDVELKSSLLSTWWDGVKNRYCPTLTFITKKD